MTIIIYNHAYYKLLFIGPESQIYRIIVPFFQPTWLNVYVFPNHYWPLEWAGNLS